MANRNPHKTAKTPSRFNNNASKTFNKTDSHLDDLFEEIKQKSKKEEEIKPLEIKPSGSPEKGL